MAMTSYCLNATQVLFECNSSIWRFLDDSRVNDFAHTSQWYGFKPEWTFKCQFLFEGQVKHIPQISHWKDFSPYDDASLINA